MGAESKKSTIQLINTASLTLSGFCGDIDKATKLAHLSTAILNTVSFYTVK